MATVSKSNTYDYNVDSSEDAALKKAMFYALNNPTEVGLTPAEKSALQVVWNARQAADA